MIPNLDDVPVIEIGVHKSISNTMLACWKKYKNNEMNLVDISPTCTFKGIQSQNALQLANFKKDKNFQKCLDDILIIPESILGVRLSYYWVTFVEYYRGGYQTIHNHAHNEEYSLILYLNTCRGGETYFDIKPPKLTLSPTSDIIRDEGIKLSFSPKKNNMLLFKSDTDHGANKTSSWFRNKTVLVCGLRKFS
tara:strand:+ start:201 stop:779 length:579 start_codon:yes stop_codon:yes gene_type:complete